MAKLIKTVDDIYIIEDKIAMDMEDAIGDSPVMVSLHVGDVDTVRPMRGDFIALETYCDVEKMEFNNYNESSDILEVIPSDNRPVHWRSYSLRSNCRVTNQPDWGDVFIHIKGDSTVTPESLLKYIVSMRKENHFHEEICECIYKRLLDLLQPEELLVTCLYTRRGGIDINPTRASSNEVLYKVAGNLIEAYNACEKTARQ